MSQVAGRKDHIEAELEGAPTARPGSSSGGESRPSNKDAWQLALMVQAGMPPIDAIRYFYPDEDNGSVLVRLAAAWGKSNAYQESTRRLQGKIFSEMGLDERINYTLELHYSQLAYFLYSNNYSTMNPAECKKADTCRQALETKLAGNAGIANPLVQFWNDVKSGKTVLAPATPTPAPTPAYVPPTMTTRTILPRIP
jgi:hypothetical protein